MKDNNFKISEETWDKIAESFDKTRKKPWGKVLDFMENFSSADLIADLGCGNGRHLLFCAKLCKEVFGFDISKNLLDIVKIKLNRDKISNATLIHSNLITIPIKENYFDFAIYIAALHNIKGRDNRICSLKELKRILKIGGKALISVWSAEQEKFRNIVEENKSGDIDIYWKQDKLNVPRFYHLYKRNEFADELNQAGLKIIDISDIKISSKIYPDNYFAIVEKIG